MSKIEFGGTLFQTESRAWGASIYDFVTAGGQNSADEAITHLTTDLDKTIEEMLENGWGISVDGEDVAPTAEIIREHLDAVVEELREEASA